DRRDHPRRARHPTLLLPSILRAPGPAHLSGTRSIAAPALDPGLSDPAAGGADQLWPIGAGRDLLGLQFLLPLPHRLFRDPCLRHAAAPPLVAGDRGAVLSLPAALPRLALSVLAAARCARHSDGDAPFLRACGAPGPGRAGGRLLPALDARLGAAAGDAAGPGPAPSAGAAPLAQRRIRRRAGADPGAADGLW